MQPRRISIALFLSLSALAVASSAMLASSHREAPAITKTPKVDGTDFYMFRSYENGRSNYVTFIANYLPLQDVYGGPNYFMLDPNAIYEIHVDKNGDAIEDMTFQFAVTNENRNFSLQVGTTAENTKTVAIPLINKGTIGPGRNDTENLNVIESYGLSVIRGGRRTGQRETVTTSDGTFKKPVDRIGDKSLPAYDTYANDHIYSVNIPGCSTQGRVFVGQRREGFAVNLAEIFDLINITAPLGSPNAEPNDLADKNVTTLALEVPITCVAMPGQPIIGAWTTASVGKGSNSSGNSSVTPKGQFSQVSRLGMALVNEVVIGLKDKDSFNASEPKGDLRFLDYVTNPTLPELIEAVAGGTAPNQFPRTDLVTVFLTGVPGLNQPPNVVPSEMLRLNTSTAVSAVQDPLGVIATPPDPAGYPNGRRPGDDVVDISLRVAMGKLLPVAVAPSGQAPFTDGTFINATVAYEPETGLITGDVSRRLFRDTFPYLERPLSGSPNPVHP